MRTNLLLGTAAIGLLITGAIAQTSSSIERIQDSAGHQKSARDSEPKKNVRTVYPNTQNAEQAIQQSKSARGQADASSKRKPGDVAPLSNAQESPKPPAGQAPQPAQDTQHTAQAPATQKAQKDAPAHTSQTTQSSTPAPAQAAQSSTQPSSAPPPAKQSVPAATAQQSNTASEHQASQPSRQGSTGVIALNTQQQTSIGQTIGRHSVKPVSNVNFSIAVGTKVPAAVQLRALPSDIVTFIPQYRGYSYVAVEEQIVIVDPGSHEIVAIVPYTAAGPATRAVEGPVPATRKVEKKPRARVAHKPMVSLPANLHTEDTREVRRSPAERKAVRSEAKREYREERAPRTVTVEEYAEPNPVQVLRSPRFVDEDDEVVVAPRQDGFFGLFR